MISIRKKIQITTAPAQKSGWLHLSQKIDSGLLLLVELAKIDSDSEQPVSLRTIAEKNGLSFFFLQKVAADLRRAKLVTAGRGKHGGYRLARSATDITMKDILEAHEGPLAIMHCLDHENSCIRENWCNVRPGLNFINQTIINTLAATTLADFIKPTTSWEISSK